MASDAKVTKNYFEFGSIKYFRGKAENIILCSYGEKKDPVGAKAWLSIQANVKTEHLVDKVQKVNPVTVNWAGSSKADVEVNGAVQYFVVNAMRALSASFEQASAGHLKMAKFFINQGPLKTMLNNDASGARKFLAKEGADGRIVSEVWVAMEAKLAEHFATSASMTTAAKVSGLDGKAALQITASGGTSKTQTIELSPGTTFAYLLHKVKSWNKDKTRIEELEEDHKGIG